MISISPSDGDISKIRQTHNTVEKGNDCALVMHASNEGYLVTRHTIINKKMLAGDLVSPQQALDILSEKANLKQSGGFIDERVLCDNDQYLVWHAKSTKRSMFFTGKKKSRLLVNWPNLVFVANKQRQGLSVFATATSKRPRMSSRIYLPPLQNIGARGSLCIGSATYPTTVGQSSIDELESCLMDSNFTHMSGVGALAKNRAHYQSSENNYKYWQTKVNKRVYAHELQPFGSLETIFKMIGGH